MYHSKTTHIPTISKVQAFKILITSKVKKDKITLKDLIVTVVQEH